MQKLEIQILTGLHAGARHAISHAAFTLGGGAKVDLRLLDDEFDGVTLSFSQLESGAFLVDAAVVSDVPLDFYSEHGRRLVQADALSPGQFIRLGSVWMTLQTRDGGLVSVPSFDERAMDAAELADDALIGSDAIDDQAADDFHGQEGLANDRPADFQRLRRKAAAGLIGGVIAILVVGLGFAWAPSEAHMPEAGKAAPAVAARPSAPSATVLGVARDQQVRNVVQTLLEQHGINQAVTARVGLGEAILSGKLDRHQIELFDRAITEIQAQVGNDFRISANIETHNPAPDFRIREVVSGKHGWIVTDKGRRVIIGGEIEGYRLTSIDGNKIVLVGPDRIEIQL